jgi:hypothetical protein
MLRGIKTYDIEVQSSLIRQSVSEWLALILMAANVINLRALTRDTRPDHAHNWLLHPLCPLHIAHVYVNEGVTVIEQTSLGGNFLSVLR